MRRFVLLVAYTHTLILSRLKPQLDERTDGLIMKKMKYCEALFDIPTGGLCVKRLVVQGEKKPKRATYTVPRVSSRE